MIVLQQSCCYNLHPEVNLYSNNNKQPSYHRAFLRLIFIHFPFLRDKIREKENAMITVGYG